MLMSEKITLYMAVWMIFLLLITSDVELEIFFILVVLGFIIIKELTDRFTTRLFKYKMNFFIFLFMIVFIILVMARIINFSEI